MIVLTVTQLSLRLTLISDQVELLLAFGTNVVEGQVGFTEVDCSADANSVCSVVVISVGTKRAVQLDVVFGGHCVIDAVLNDSQTSESIGCGNVSVETQLAFLEVESQLDAKGNVGQFGSLGAEVFCREVVVVEATSADGGFGVVFVDHAVVDLIHLLTSLVLDVVPLNTGGTRVY